MNRFERANCPTMSLPPASFGVYRPIKASLMPTARYGDSLKLRRIDIKGLKIKLRGAHNMGDPSTDLTALSLSKSFPGTQWRARCEQRKFRPYCAPRGRV